MSKFNFIKTDIPDVQIIEPTVFGDDRGYFMETYQIDEFAAAGIDKPFVSTCSGPTAAASTRPAPRTRSTPRLPPRSSNILRNIEGKPCRN